MPLYVISHKDDIGPSQRDELAATITKIHTTLFTTPQLFVNVKFEDVSATSYYVGGKRTSVNSIHANVRPGSSRPRSSYDELCQHIRVAWERILPASIALNTIFVHGTIIAGEEQGFQLPEAGRDSEWLQQYMPEFVRKAAEGNEDMKALVEECEERSLVG